MSWFEMSELFRIQKVEFQGLSNLTEERLNSYLAEIRGQSLLRIDLDETRRKLETEPWISSVLLKRHFPDKIDVKVREKIPFAYIREGTDTYLLDESGKLITKVTSSWKSLPEMKGILLSKWIREDEKELRKVHRGVEFIQAAMKPNFLIEKDDLTRIIVRSEDDLDVTIGGISFLFRYPYSAQQWLRFLAIRNDILARNIVIENIDLRYTGKIIVNPVREKA